MPDFFYKGIWRMDWGFGNPNKTATLIAMLMLAVWGLAYIRRWGFWTALVLFTGLGICLIHTFSRGGLIALFFGIIPLTWFIPRPWQKNRWSAIAISICLVIGVAIYLNAHERYGKGTEDRSISNRLELWKASPKMMVAAPDGWGLGNAGNAYVQWYQPLNRAETYRTLVNSHLTWLVEFGWAMRIAYILGWTFVLLLCWPVKKHSWMAIPLGIWMAFFVAALFSSVAESLSLWIIPILALVAVLIIRTIEKDWPNSWASSTAVVLTGLITMTVYLLGCQENFVHLRSGVVKIGSSEPEIFLVVDPKVVGENYGRKLRTQLKECKLTPQLAIAESIDSLGSMRGKIVVITGSISKRSMISSMIMESSKIILLNPSYFPQELGLTQSKIKEVEVFFGEFSQSPSIGSWQQMVEVKRLEGVGDFVLNWPQLLFSL